MKPYPKYKDFGAAWLGKVSMGWHVLCIGAIFNKRKELNKEGDVDFILSVTKNRGVIPYAKKGNIENKASDDITGYKMVRKNDIILNSTNVIFAILFHRRKT